MPVSCKLELDANLIVQNETCFFYCQFYFFLWTYEFEKIFTVKLTGGKSEEIEIEIVSSGARKEI